MFKSIPTWVAELRKNLDTCSATEAKQKLSADGGVLIDVREPAEWADGCVESAIKMPRGVLEMKLPSVVTDPSTPIYLHCATGGRATFAAKQLRELGYQNVNVITCDAGTVCGIF